MGILAEKDENFKAFKWCECFFISLFSGCALPILSPSICWIDTIYNDAFLRLNKDSIEFSQPLPSCCTLANTKRTVKFDKITDVTVEDDCIMQMFGIKKVVVQTAGTGGVGPGVNIAGVQAMFLHEPEKWKDAINHAQTIFTAPESQGMAATSAMTKNIEGRITRLDELYSLPEFQKKVGNDWIRVRSNALLAEKDYTQKLLSIAVLRNNRKLPNEVFEGAIDTALNALLLRD